MDPVALLAAVCVLGAIVTGLVGFYKATASPRLDMDRRLGRIMGESLGNDFVSAANMEGLREHRSRKLPIIGGLLEGRNWTATLAEDLERADVRLNVSEYIALRIFLALALMFVPFIMLGGLLGMIAALIAGFLGFKLLPFWVRRSRSKRVSKLDGQLPDALSMLSNSLKAGFGLMQSLELASRELAHPVATEIRRMLQEINVGSTTEEALLNFSKRSGSNDLDIVVTAMLIQQSTGGNLGEILDNVGHTMRERIRIRGEIKTLTTQGLMTGAIIGGLPVFIGLAVSLLNPGYIDPLFNTLIGNAMLGGAVMMEAFGLLVIKKILVIEV